MAALKGVIPLTRSCALGFPILEMAMVAGQATQGLALPEAPIADGKQRFECLKLIIGDAHPYAWLREQCSEERLNVYHAAMLEKMEVAAVLDSTLPVEIFESADDDDPEAVVVPLSMINFREVTKIDDSQMQTCWRVHSACRIMDGISKTLQEGKGIRTATEKPHIVAAHNFKGVPLRDLQFVCAHGIGSTRLMIAHVLSLMRWPTCTSTVHDACGIRTGHAMPGRYSEFAMPQPCEHKRTHGFGSTLHACRSLKCSSAHMVSVPHA